MKIIFLCDIGFKNKEKVYKKIILPNCKKEFYKPMKGFFQVTVDPAKDNIQIVLDSHFWVM